MGLVLWKQFYSCCMCSKNTVFKYPKMAFCWVELKTSIQYWQIVFTWFSPVSHDIITNEVDLSLAVQKKHSAQRFSSLKQIFVQSSFISYLPGPRPPRNLYQSLLLVLSIFKQIYFFLSSWNHQTMVNLVNNMAVEL